MFWFSYLPPNPLHDSNREGGLNHAGHIAMRNVSPCGKCRHAECVAMRNVSMWFMESLNLIVAIREGTL